MGDSHATQRDKLVALLLPMHERARLTARRLCRSDADGDDLFQDATIHALTRIEDLRDDKAFPAWFYRILLSLHRTRMRQSFWRRLLPLDTMTSSSAHHEPIGEDGSTWEEKRQGAARMREALATLPAVQREAVVLFDIDGYSLAEVAELQNTSLSAVKTRLARGRARLEKHYTARYTRALSGTHAIAIEAPRLATSHGYAKAERHTP